MPDTKFTIDVDAARGIAAYQGLATAEKQATGGLRELAVAASTADTAVSKAAAASTYEFASAAAAGRRATPLPRAAGEAYIRPGRNARELDLAARSVSAGPDVRPLADVGGYAMVRSAEEQASRDALARQIRAERYATRGELAAPVESLGFAAALQAQNVVSAHIRAETEAAQQAASDKAFSDFENANAKKFNYGRRSDYQLLQAHRGGDVNRDTNDAYRRTAGTLVKPDNPAMREATGLIGGGALAVGVALYAAGSAIGRHAEKLDNLGRANVAFAEEMKPLLSLGENLRHAQGLQSQVLAMSGAYGQDRGAITGSLFMLQSAAANMSEKQRGQIMSASAGINQVAGGDLQSDITAVVKLMQTYGAEMGNAQKAAAKLVVTEDQAAITMQELATMLPDVLPAAKLMGVTYDEVAASIITATQVMGNNEKTLTGLRNMFLKLGEAQQAGLVHAGRLTDKLHELSRVDPMVLSKVFGEREVAVVSALAEKSAEVAQNVKTMQAVTGNEVFQKFLNAMTHGDLRDAAEGKSIRQAEGNIDTIRSQNGGLRSEDERWQLQKLGYESTLSPFLAAVLPDFLKNIAIKEDDLGGRIPGSNNIQLEKGVNLQIGNLLKSGDAQSLFRAHVLELKYGEVTGSKRFGAPYGDPKHPEYNREATDEDDAASYTQIAQRLGRDPGLKTYSRYQQFQATAGQTSADAFINSIDRRRQGTPAAAASTFTASGGGAGQMIDAARAQQSAATHLEAAAARLERAVVGPNAANVPITRPRNPNAHTE